MRNIFLEKSYAKCVGEARQDPFIKNQNWAYGSTVWSVIKFVFIVCPSRGLPKYIKSKLLSTYFYFKAIKLF